MIRNLSDRETEIEMNPGKKQNDGEQNEDDSSNQPENTGLIGPTSGNNGNVVDPDHKSENLDKEPDEETVDEN